MQHLPLTKTMRYSTIHHDVREQFELTISEYLVCDSIQQLSYHAPTKKSNREIARFLGIDEISVRRAKISLEKKQLITPSNEGFSCTSLWTEAVLYAKTLRQNVATGATKSPHSIINIYKNTEAKASPLSLPVVEVSESSKSPRVPRDNTAMRLREWCYKQIEDDTGVRPITSQGDYVRLVEALKYLKESEIKEMMTDAIDQGKGQTVRGVFTNRAIDVYRQENA